MDAHTYTLTHSQTSIIRRHRAKGKMIGNQTHKVPAAFVQEPVSEPNGFGMEHRCMYRRTRWHTHTRTNQHRKKASFMEMKTAFWELADPLGADILCPCWSSESSKSRIDRWRRMTHLFSGLSNFHWTIVSSSSSNRSFWGDKWFRHAFHVSAFHSGLSFLCSSIIFKCNPRARCLHVTGCQWVGQFPCRRGSKCEARRLQA